jgi:hypothetical protein
MTDTERREEALKLWRVWNAACVALDLGAADLDSAALRQLKDAEADALAAYHAGGCSFMANAEFDDVERCAMTGVPILTTDDVVMVLRSALPEKVEKAA